MSDRSLSSNLSLIDRSAPHWRPAEFAEPAGDRLRCTLCPRLCELADGEIGECRVRRRNGDGLETMTFATTVRHVDPIERKPLYHFRPGLRVLTLAPAGCTFTCHYCTNYRISQYGRLAELDVEAEPVDPEAIVREAAHQGTAIGLSYSEPILAAELTLALAQIAHPLGVPLIWKSNGYITPEALERLIPCLTAVNIDVKASTDAKHRALTGAPLTPTWDTIRALHRADIWVELSTPVIPNVNADVDSLRAIAESLCRVSRDIPWHLLRFTPDFRLNRLPPTSPDQLREAVRIAREVGLRYVYVERALGPEGRETRCPGCHAPVVRRDIWATVEVSLNGDACPHCGKSILGRWY